MMARRPIVLATTALCLFGIQACSSSRDLDVLQQTPRVGLRHNVALMDEYQALALHEAQQRVDYTDADYFAAKGLAAAAGQEVLPDEVASRAVPPDMVDELTAARAELVAVIFSGGREFQPELTARCQALFDCWIVQAEEAGGRDRLAECRDGFRRCMTELAARPAPPVGSGQEYEVLFGPGSATLNAAARATVEEVAALAAQNLRLAITVVGHTDSQGSAEANQRLSLRRAEAVRDALVSAGIDPERIRTLGAGETEAAARLGDGVADPQSRRVVVTTM
jgi:OOP family OmpA-OmpF porin